MLEGYSARAGQLVLVEQQPQQPRLSNKPVVLVGGKVGGGQKEAEQPMNPNEVIINGEGGPRMLEPLAAEVAELEDLETSAAYDDFEKRAKWNSMQGKGERLQFLGAKLKLMMLMILLCSFDSITGGWGKRAPNNWNKLSAAWGK